MRVDGEPFSASLVGVEFADSATGTILTCTEQGFFLIGDYDAESRSEGAGWLIDRKVEYLERKREWREAMPGAFSGYRSDGFVCIVRQITFHSPLERESTRMS